MKLNQIKLKVVAVSIVFGILILITLNAGGGNLEPNAPPGPTMHTLEDIYEVVSSETEPPAQPFAFDMYLTIEGIPGESKVGDHEDEIDVLSWSWGARQSEGIARPDYQDLTITKYIDKSSPILAVYACAGGTPAGSSPISYAKLEICSAEDSNNCIMEYLISDVNVTSVNTVGYIRTSNERPTEEVTFNYRKIEWTYVMSDGNSIHTGWDIDADAPIDPCGVLPSD